MPKIENRTGKRKHIRKLAKHYLGLEEIFQLYLDSGHKLRHKICVMHVSTAGIARKLKACVRIFGIEHLLLAASLSIPILMFICLKTC